MLRIKFTALVVALFSIGLGSAEAKTYRGKVTKISDGDTIGFLADDAPEGSKPWSIRMMIEDTAELHLPTQGGMASQGYWAEEGLRQLEKMLKIGDRVEIDSFGKDAYGRTLGRVYKGNIDINLEMILSGWGAMYLICDDGEDCADEQARAACKEAFSAGRGLFNPDRPVPELPFLFRARMQKKPLSRFVGSMKTGRYYAPKDFKKVHICDRVFFSSASSARAAGYEPDTSIGR